MTTIRRVGSAAPNAPRRAYASEFALHAHPDILHWWDCSFAQRWPAGLTGASRKRPHLVGTLVNPTGLRPGQENTIDGRAFLTTPSSDSPTPPIIVTEDGAVPDTGDFTIWTIIGKLGTSALASAWSIVGDDGNTLGLRTRSSNRVSLNLDASSTALLEATGVTDAPHLIEVAYDRSENTAYLRIDNVSKSSAVMTGWTQATTKLAFLGVYDETDGALAYGRTLKWNGCIVAKTSPTETTSARQAVHAMVADVFPSITLS